MDGKVLVMFWPAEMQPHEANLKSFAYLISSYCINAIILSD